MVLHRDDFGVGVFIDIGFDGGVRIQRGTAGQGFAVVALEVHQGKGIGRAMVHITVFHRDLARATQTMATGVWNVDALTQRRIQNGLTFLHFDGGAQGFQGELIAHGVS